MGSISVITRARVFEAYSNDSPIIWGLYWGLQSPTKLGSIWEITRALVLGLLFFGSSRALVSSLIGCDRLCRAGMRYVGSGLRKGRFGVGTWFGLGYR